VPGTACASPASDNPERNEDGGQFEAAASQDARQKAEMPTAETPK
jgi:hypothetical protein